MLCPKCGNEMRSGYLFSSKDGAFSFASGSFSEKKRQHILTAGFRCFEKGVIRPQ